MMFPFQTPPANDPPKRLLGDDEELEPTPHTAACNVLRTAPRSGPLAEALRSLLTAIDDGHTANVRVAASLVEHFGARCCQKHGREGRRVAELAREAFPL